MKNVNYSRRGRWLGALSIVGLFLVFGFLAFCVNNTVPRLGGAANIVAIIAWIAVSSKAEKNIIERYDKRQEEYNNRKNGRDCP